MIVNTYSRCYNTCMSKYSTSMKIITNCGGTPKEAEISISVEAESSEEATTRLRSACSRIMLSTNPKQAGERILFSVDDKVLGGSEMLHPIRSFGTVVLDRNSLEIQPPEAGHFMPNNSPVQSVSFINLPKQRE